jgi:hypothetical protein
MKRELKTLKLGERRREGTYLTGVCKLSTVSFWGVNTVSTDYHSHTLTYTIPFWTQDSLQDSLEKGNSQDSPAAPTTFY